MGSTDAHQAEEPRAGPEQGQAQASPDISASTGEATIDEAQNAKPRGPLTCQICDVNPSKYKCSRCYLPYCSVACNKQHQENHPPDVKPERKPEPTPEPKPECDLISRSTRRDNPFHVLDDSEKLSWLFRKYPKLPQQLLDINAATQPPPEDPSKQIPPALRMGTSTHNKWTRDVGIRRGKAALRRARGRPGEEGEAIREYCTLISMLLNGETGEESRQLLQQQFKQDDTQLIRQLIQQEEST